MDEILLNNGFIKIKKTTLGLYKVSIENKQRRLTVSRLGETLGDAWGMAVHAYSGETLSVFVPHYDTDINEDLEYTISSFLDKQHAKLKITLHKCTIESYRYMGGKVILANVSAKTTHKAISEAVAKSHTIKPNQQVSQEIHYYGIME